MCDLARADQVLTIREVAEEPAISFVSCQAFLTKYLDMRHVSEVHPMAAGSTAGALPVCNL
jgi:hypothetical protein